MKIGVFNSKIVVKSRRGQKRFSDYRAIIIIPTLPFPISDGLMGDCFRAIRQTTRNANQPKAHKLFERHVPLTFCHAKALSASESDPGTRG